MNKVIMAYYRFIHNYHNGNGGINLYPQFDSDLEVLLNFIGTRVMEGQNEKEN